MVRLDSVALALRPWLGEAFLRACGVCAQAGGALNGFDPARGDLDALSRQLDSLLFNQVRTVTQGDMRVLLDDGRVERVRVDDIGQMADDLLYLLLRQLPRTEWQYQRLRQFAMTHASLSALRALYVDFASFQTEDELAVIARTVRSAYPAFRWRVWLPEKTL